MGHGPVTGQRNTMRGNFHYYNADFKNPSCPICEFFLQIIYPNPCQTAATKRTNQNHGGLELKNDQKVKPSEADWI
jgi:hypothetical protein